MNPISLESAKSIQVHNDGADKAFVFGHQFGACLVVITDSIEEAFNEWDERFGQRVEEDTSALADYEGNDDAERIESAMGCGDIRTNDGGTTVWVDPYEWVREFDSIGSAFAFAFSLSD